MCVGAVGKDPLANDSFMISSLHSRLVFLFSLCLETEAFPFNLCVFHWRCLLGMGISIVINSFTSFVLQMM